MREPDLRSWLLTPCLSDAACASGADVAILDLLLSSDPGAQVRPWAVEARRALRLAVKIGDAIEGDLDAVMPAAPWAILAPCRSGADVQRLAAKIAVREARFGLVDGATRIVAAVGDAVGVLNGASFAGASARLAALTFDPGSLNESLSAPRARLAPSLARGLTILAAAAAGIAAIDGPADPGATRAEAESALREGFSGKIATTPEEVAIIHAVFAKSA